MSSKLKKKTTQALKKLKHLKKYESMIIFLQVAKHTEKLYDGLTTSLDLKSQTREMKY